MKKLTTIAVILLFCIQIANAQEKPDADAPKPAAGDAAEMAKKLANPVAAMISVPFQTNLDVGIGAYDGYKSTTNVQPVIPIGLNKDWNLISRIILPVVNQQNITGEGEIQTGLGDAVVSAFFSPALPKNGLIWGLGPVLLIPTATDEFLGAEKLGVGPTVLILKQTHGWTIGALANQIWSLAGNSDRSDVNSGFLQPFLTYSYKSGAGLGLVGEITQNWNASTTTVWLTPNVSGITKIGKQLVQLQVGPRFQVVSPDGGKAKFGIRAQVVLVFPK